VERSIIIQWHAFLVLNLNKTKMHKIISFIVIALLAGYNFLNAQKATVVVSDKPGWHKIAETTASFEKEEDQVDVLLNDRFSALKFKVTDAPLELISVDVFFEDGTKQTIQVVFAIKKTGDTTREIDIDGPGERKLDKIIFRYRSLPNRNDKKAHVEIWGKKIA
jgi:hypothetical protein